MFKLRSINRVFPALVLVTFFFCGCGISRYAIMYDLNEIDIYSSKFTKPYTVLIATFSDERDRVEREISARRARGDTGLLDYTYDKEFQGDVAEEITMMLIKHINYSKVFASETMPASFRTGQLSAELLDSLGETGIDAVMTGEINHFYGYYDQNFGRQLLYSVPLAVASAMLFQWTFVSGDYIRTWYWYGPGLYLGGYLESLHERPIKQHVNIRAKLISTTTQQPLWEDSFEILSVEPKSMPGFSTAKRKFQVIVWSLRDAVNQMVASLEKTFL